MGSWGGEDSPCQAGPRNWKIIELTGQAAQPLADPEAPHSLIDKPGGMEQNRLRNPELQIREIKPQTSDWKHHSEGQIPYDLTFNLNIINRRKQETKYNQRH